MLDFASDGLHQDVAFIKSHDGTGAFRQCAFEKSITGISRYENQRNIVVQSMNLAQQLSELDVFQIRIGNYDIPLGGLKGLFKLLMCDHCPGTCTETGIAHQTDELFCVVLSLRQ